MRCRNICTEGRAIYLSLRCELGRFTGSRCKPRCTRITRERVGESVRCQWFMIRGPPYVPYKPYMFSVISRTYIRFSDIWKLCLLRARCNHLSLQYASENQRIDLCRCTRRNKDYRRIERNNPSDEQCGREQRGHFAPRRQFHPYGWITAKRRSRSSRRRRLVLSMPVNLAYNRRERHGKVRQGRRVGCCWTQARTEVCIGGEPARNRGRRGSFSRVAPAVSRTTARNAAHNPRAVLSDVFARWFYTNYGLSPCHCLHYWRISTGAAIAVLAWYRNGTSATEATTKYRK